MAQTPQNSLELSSLKELLREIPDCVLQLDVQSGDVRFASDKFQDLTGLTSDQCQTIQSLFDLRVEDFVPWREVFAGQTVEYDFSIRSPDIIHNPNQERWLRLKGKINGGEFHGLLFDVTDRVLESTLSSTLIDSVATSGQEILVFDVVSEVLLYANTTAESNLAYSMAELSELPLDQYYLGGSERFNEVAASASLEGNHETRHVLIRRDGSQYDLVANCILQHDSGTKLILVGRDQTSINRLRKMEEEVRERYRRALNGSETDIFEWDIRNDRFHTTPGVAEWLGVGFEEVSGTGDDVKKFVHPADLDRFEQIVSEVIFEPNHEYFNEYRLVAPNGEIVWVQARGKVQRDGRGRATMLSGTTTNITERKQAQKDLQNQISTLAAVLDNIADGIIALDGDGVVTMVNPKAVSILKRSREELLGGEVLEHFKPRDMDIGSWSSVADGAMREAELLDGHGRVVAIEFAVSESRLVEQDLHIVVFRDITGRKRFEREILYAKERAEYAAKAKTDFLATMSHEIRTPLNGILGMAQLLLETGLNSEQLETARVIHSSGEALLTIINDILDFSKIDAGKLEVESELFDLRTAISDVLEIVHSKSETGAVPLLLEYPLNLAHRIYGDAGRIKQVLLNLLGNAVKFTEQGSIKVSVEPIASNSDREDWQRFEISVRDTGIGIPEDMHGQLFESFRQADVSTTRKYGGTGLGLAICKQLVELMGGEIGLESEPGVGTRFWFRVSFPTDDVRCNPILSDKFPELEAVVWHPNEFIADNLIAKLREAGLTATRYRTLDELLSNLSDDNVLGFFSDVIEPAAIDSLRNKASQLHPILLTSIGAKQKQLHQASRANSFLNLPLDDRLLIAQLHRGSDEEVIPETAPPLPDQEVFDGLRVLLAEDNIVNQKVISRMLTKKGCRVDVAENGLDAVNMSNEEEYDLIFMDLRMPEKDGIEAVMDIRRRELQRNLNRIPIVAMTANAMGGDRDACIDAGMDDYVAKPVQIAKLTQVLERWVKSS